MSSEVDSQRPRESLDAIDCSRSPHTSSKVEATRCGEVSKAAGQIIDLGFCPRCFDVIQPTVPDGYPSLEIAGVLFCVHCAIHGVGLWERVEWAKKEARAVASF